MDALLLKVNVYTEGLQFPHGFQGGQGVAGEAGNRLRDDLVDLSRTAVGEHSLEFRSVVVRAANGIVGIHANVIPFDAPLDVRAVVRNLGGQGVPHGVLAVRDSGIGCGALAPLDLRQGFDFGYSRSHFVSLLSYRESQGVNPAW